MDNIDDLMQHKQNNDDPQGRFQFREEYWDQARALIEADEAQRRKRRRRVIFWWFCTLLAVGAGFAWYATSYERVLPDSGKTTTTVPENAPSTQNRQENKARISTDTVHHAAYPDPDNKAPKQFTSGFNHKNSNPAGQPYLLNKNNQNVEKNKPARPGSSTVQIAVKGEKGSLARAGDIKNQAFPSDNPGHSAEEGAEGRENNGNPVQAPATATQLPVDSASLQGAAPAFRQFLQTLFELPLPMKDAVSVQEKKAIVIPVVTQPIAERIEKTHENKKLQVGLSAAGAAFQKSPDNKWLGASAGAFVLYHLDATWSLALGLNAKFQPGGLWRLDSSYTNEFYSRLFSYGIEETYTRRDQTGLLSLEIPLGLQWQSGAFGLEAGAGYGKLLFALERLKMQERNSFSELHTTRNRIERGDKAPYAQNYGLAYAGVFWQPIQPFSIGIRAQYRFGPILPATSKDPAVKGGSHVELSARWKF